MNRSVKAVLVSVFVVLALGIGYFTSKLANQDEPRSNNETANTSSSGASGATLDLSGQQLSALPESAMNRTDITVLNISNNQLAALPASISGLTNLVELNVENNRLESLPPEIGQLKNLRKLRVGNNRITALPDELGNMIWLKELNISNNRLSQSQLDQIKAKLTDTEVKT